MSKETTLRAALEKSLQEIERLDAEIERLRGRSHEPVAILSMACRYPGGVEAPEDLWRLLDQGANVVGPFPAERGWDATALHSPDPDAPGRSVTDQGGFLYDADRFDAGFFGVSPREAERIDPQQRLLLECSWEALERAGLAPHTLKDSATGVFVGLSYTDYGGRMLADPTSLDGSVMIGSTHSTASGRISYTLGLRGPAVTIDTACSSSLVAVHLACLSLQVGECDLVLAGGAAVMATPLTFIEFSRQRGLSPDGRCRPFGAAADGTGWSEGCGLLVLKRLSDARRDGDRVLAVLRGTAVNQDGRSQGLTAPNGSSQEEVIRQALRAAGLTAADVDAVEAHGTGTRLGDPIEAEALLATYGRAHGPDRPLYLGSIKSNLGHTQAAAGVAGIMKMVLALENERLPRTLYADPPSPLVDWTQGHVKLLSAPVPWPAGRGHRRAGVSSFGVSGTNAHAILEDVEDVEPTHGGAAETGRAAPGHLALVLSGRDEPALRAQAGRLASHLRARRGEPLLDVAASLATTRAHLPARLGWREDAGAPPEDVAAALAAFAAGERPPRGAWLGRGEAAPGKLAIQFTGGGSQRPGMGHGLYQALPVFRATLDEVCARLDREIDRPVRELMFAAPDGMAARQLDLTGYTQPALFALEVALYRQWEAFGLRPDFLIGHSSGELVAAHVAGVLDLDDACTLAAARARLMQALPPGGAMAALEASEAEVETMLARVRGLELAVVNGPETCVVSGDEAEVQRLCAHLEAQGRKATRLAVSIASHSRRMEPMLDEYRRIARSLRYRAPRIPVVCNLTGRRAGEELAGAEYWVRQVRERVRYADGVATLAEAGVTTFLECGPHGVLTTMAAQCLAARAAPLVTVASLRRDRPELETFVEALCAVYVQGHEVAWDAVFEDSGARLVDLPTYAFQRQRYWRKAPAPGRPAMETPGAHPLVSSVVAVADTQATLLSGRLSTVEQPWLADHAVFGAAVFPGAGFAELALLAADATGAAGIRELTITAPLVLPTHGAMELQISARADRSFSIYGRAAGDGAATGWTEHAAGVFDPSRRLPLEATELCAWPPAGSEPIDLRDAYPRLAAEGLEYGPAFQGVVEAHRGPGGALYARVRLPDQLRGSAGAYRIHPALLDAALHVLPLVESIEGRRGALLSFSWSDLRLEATGATELRVGVSPAAAERPDQVSRALVLCDEAGGVVARVGALTARRATPEQVRGRAASAQHLYRLEWTPARVEDAPWVASRQVVVGGDGELAWWLGARQLSDLDEDINALDAGPPARLVLDATLPPSGPSGACIRERAGEVLAILTRWLNEPRLCRTELVVVTRGAVSVAGEAVEDLGGAAVWGLARVAREEHADRTLRLVDVGSDAPDEELLRRAVGAVLEPELALREGALRAPRLVAETGEPAHAPILDVAGTVLVTGGTGALGRRLAVHLVRRYGARHLVLASRRGREAPGAAALIDELRAAGACSVEVVACDISRRERVAALMARVPAERPLTAVLHLAGELDDAPITSLTPERLERAFRAKVDGALHLDALTAAQERCAWVLFSSAAGTLGTVGQGSYAAANACLDALATRLRARGRAAISLAWGLWDPDAAPGMAAAMGKAGRARLERRGVQPLAPEEGLRLFDRAVALDRAGLVPAALSPAAAEDGRDVPALLRELVRAAPVRRPAAASAATSRAPAGAPLRERLARLPPPERRRLLLELVRGEIAEVLALPGPEAVPPQKPLRDLGFDSLTAVMLRSRLVTRMETSLPATLVFDHPTSDAISEFLLREAAPGAEEPS